jgi:hypothetical protein
LEVRKQYRTEITKRVVAFDNVSDEKDILRALESIRYMKNSDKEILGPHEMKQHKL